MLRIAFMNYNYDRYVQYFYRKNEGIDRKSFAEQRAALDYDGFGWADFWPKVLEQRGYETFHTVMNAGPLQRAWAREHGSTSTRLTEIIIDQLESFRPDVLITNPRVCPLQAVVDGVPGIRLILGWTGSAVLETDRLKHAHCMLTCAPEARTRLRKLGLRARQIHYAFDPDICDRVGMQEKVLDASFVGQLLRHPGFHNERERILDAVASRIPTHIYAPGRNVTLKARVRHWLECGAYEVSRWLRALGVPGDRLSVFRDIDPRDGRPQPPIYGSIRRSLCPPVFGLDMFRVLAQSKVTLNVHADTSPLAASNMRLFEATGIGTCLVTDWRQNLGELFDEQQEVVTYRNAEECVERVRWLLDHPAEVARIARAGRRRCHTSHSFQARAEVMEGIIKEEWERVTCVRGQAGV